MKWILWLAFFAGCQRANDQLPNRSSGAADTTATVVQLPRAAITEDYKQDVANVCDAVNRSGADRLPAASRAPSVAMWLGPNIRTDAAREFLAAIQPLSGEPKAAALEFEAVRVGIRSCPLAAEWRSR